MVREVGNIVKRIKNWEKVLDEQITNAKSKSFAWSHFDCCIFVADAVKAIASVDIAEDLRGKYDSAETALAAIKAYAGGGLSELCEKKSVELSIPSVPVLLAQRGDIVLVTLPVAQSDGINQSIGIVGLDGRFVLCASEKGIVRLPQKYWVKAWSTR